MENYIIFANKQFNDWNELEHKLDVLFASKKHYVNIYAYNTDDQKKLWNLLVKYCHYNDIKLINIMDIYDWFDVRDVIIFKNKETPAVKKFIKFLKPLRIKPIIYNSVPKVESKSWKQIKAELEKELKEKYKNF